MNLIKKTSSALVLSFVVLGSAALTTFSVGCASTPTKESAGEYVDDSAITTKVKAALIRDDLVKAGDVNVETFKGVVQLSGFVDNAAQKAQAGRVAAGITGVRDVKNNISVK